MDDMDQYLVVLKSGQKYLFWAENTDHAKEQALDAEHEALVDSVYKLELVWFEGTVRG